LGIRYRDGKGVQRDYGEAVKWFRHCADRGNAEGMDNVGFMYLRGWGVPLNEDIAAAFFKAGAARGNAQARYNLGTCYFSGRGVEQDYTAAIEAWQRAAERQHDNSIWRLSILHAAGEHLPQDRRKALQLSHSIAERGHLSGILLSGELHAQLGEHEAARRWWKKAADRGSDQAKALLALAEWRHQDPVEGSRAYVEVDHIYQGWNNCGATSMAMFARHAGSDATPYSIKRLCPQSPIGTGTDWEHLIAAGTKLGQRWKLVTFTNDDAGFADGVKAVRDHLDQGQPVVIDFTVEKRENGKVRKFGHTLLVVGYHAGLDQFVLKNPNQPSPGIQLMSAEQLKAKWYSAGYSQSAKGRVARPLIVVAKR
jgi:tetratricopeptide (TPR) repeat protein